MRAPLAVAIACACACSSAKSSAPLPTPPPPPREPVAVPAPDREPVAASPIPADSTQLITTIVADWDATTGVMTRWHRVKGTIAWKSDGDGWPVVVGKAGTAWGRGLHGEAAPAGRSGPTKIEGDGKAPAGAFELRGAYGYAAQPPAGTALPYAQLGSDMECVDDPASRHYTQILERAKTDADWTSAEQMRRHDALYTWVIDIAHNPDATRGAGSCIFLHVWRDARSPTVGCTAMAEDKLVALLGMLAPAASPVYVLLPRDDYAGLRGAWGLPAQDASEKVSP